MEEMFNTCYVKKCIIKFESTVITICLSRMGGDWSLGPTCTTNVGVGN